MNLVKMRSLSLFYILLISLFLFSCSETDDTSESMNIEAPSTVATPLPVASVSPLPSPIPVETSEPIDTSLVLTSIVEGFENGWGLYLDGGLFAGLSSEKVYEGTNSVRLFSDNGVISSFLQRTPMDLTRAHYIEINFWLYAENLDDGDALLVDFSDGTQWQTVSRLVKGENFGNDSFQPFNIKVSAEDYNFSQVARVSFVSATRGNPIFIDDISITVANEETTSSAFPDFDELTPFPYDHIGVDSGCIGCHDNRIWEGKSASHLTSSNECQFCHIANNIDDWQSLTYDTGTFDHTNIENQCLDCHNFILAAGKAPTHIDSSNNCEQCHSTRVGGWNLLEPGQTYLHEGIVTGCLSCHDGSISGGKSENHIVSSDNCENCHTPNLPWSNISAFDHGNIVDNCDSCHNGNIAQGKGVFHIPSTNNCESCHSPDNGWFLLEGERFDHGDITTGCVACHNGVSTVGKSISHPPASDNCDSCHLINQSWSEATLFDHTGITTGCASCHNNINAQGKGAFHIPSSNNCETCHQPNQGWLINVVTSFDHEAIVDSCVSCHNGEITDGKHEEHIETHDRCEECHRPLGDWQFIF